MDICKNVLQKLPLHLGLEMLSAMFPCCVVFDGLLAGVVEQICDVFGSVVLEIQSLKSSFGGCQLATEQNTDKS